MTTRGSRSRLPLFPLASVLLVFDGVADRLGLLYLLLGLTQPLHGLLQLLLLLGVGLPFLVLLQLLHLLLGLLKLLLSLIQGLRIGLGLSLLNLLHGLTGILYSLLVLLILLLPLLLSLLPGLFVLLIRHKQTPPYPKYGGRLKKPADNYFASMKSRLCPPHRHRKRKPPEHRAETVSV